MSLKRIFYQVGLSQERFLENGGGNRKPTLLRVKALLGDDAAALPRTFGIVLETEQSGSQNQSAETPQPRIAPKLYLILGGTKKNK